MCFDLVFRLRAKQKRGQGIDAPLWTMSRPTAYRLVKPVMDRAGIQGKQATAKEKTPGEDVTQGYKAVKEFRFINKQSLKEFKALPANVQKRFALDIEAVCQGKDPFSKFKHIGDSVGAGAIELVENGRPAYRTVYVAKLKGVVYILHSFTKTTNGVDRKAMAIAKKRYKAMLAEVKK